MKDSLANSIDQIRRFIDERNWQKFQTPKSLAMSVAIEAAELMEHFQWTQTPEEDYKYSEKNKKEIAFEMADVAIYLLELSQCLEVDLIAAINTKLKKNAVKYPLKKASKFTADFENSVH